MQPAEGDSAAMRRKQTLEYFTRALQEVQASNEAFRVLKTVSAQPTRGSGSNSNIDSNGSGSGSVTSNRSSNPLVILDSSFNPPTVAHAQMATSALNAEPPDSRLMLLLAVNNADKKPVPAAFPHRLGMMEGFARDILSSGDVRDRGGGVQIDLAVTTEAFFHAKASSIAGSGRYGGPSRFLFLCGFDTVVRIFDPAYYAAAEEAGRSGQRAAMRAALGPFFDRARLRVTMRPGDDDDDGWGGAQDQVAGEARFLIREPNNERLPVTLQIRAKSSELLLDHSPWEIAAKVQLTTNETDFTEAVTVALAHSEQRWYEWKTSNNFTGEFLAPPKPGDMPTFHGGKFTFLSTSCILPRFPYNPVDHALAIPGLRHLARMLPNLGAQFMLFLGDFIYIDVPERFGKSTEEYRMQYRQVYASPDWAPVGQNLSWIHVLDDHEISNDWSSNKTGIYEAAVGPWHTYQAAVNPPAAVMAGTRGQRRKDATWYEFVQGPASFFLLDTRSHRSSNGIPFDDEHKTMLGPDQLADLLAWLARPEPKGVKWKFVASSVPFTKNWPVNVKDTWGGFLVERKKILEAMWNAGAHGTTVVILSGDRHEFAATKFPPPPESEWSELSAAYEFSTSPLNQFASPIPTYKQTDDEDVQLKYIPSGSSKFGSFTIENVDGNSTLQYRLFIDGEERWTTKLIQAPAVDGPKAGGGSFWDRIKFL